MIRYWCSSLQRQLILDTFSTFNYNNLLWKQIYKIWSRNSTKSMLFSCSYATVSYANKQLPIMRRCLKTILKEKFFFKINVSTCTSRLETWKQTNVCSQLQLFILLWFKCFFCGLALPCWKAKHMSWCQSMSEADISYSRLLFITKI